MAHQTKKQHRTDTRPSVFTKHGGDIAERKKGDRMFRLDQRARIVDKRGA